MREEERTIIVGDVDVVVIIVVDAEVDAGTAFQGSKESICHVGTDPVGHSVQFVARQESTVVLVVVAGVNVVHFWVLPNQNLPFLQREKQIVRTIA